METPRQCAEHCRRWLADGGLTYCQASREAFARAHPSLCGHAYEVTLRGYEHWLERRNLLDDLDTFATYLAARFERALLAAWPAFLAHKDVAHAIDVQEMIERGLVGEHQMRWADAGWHTQQR